VAQNHKFLVLSKPFKQQEQNRQKIRLLIFAAAFFCNFDSILIKFNVKNHVPTNAESNYVNFN